MFAGLPFEQILVFTVPAIRMLVGVVKELFSSDDTSSMASWDEFFPLPQGDKKYWAVKLFRRSSSLVDDLFGPKYVLKQDELEAAKKCEEEESALHPGLHKVWFSRPIGLDKGTHYVLIVDNRKYELRNKKNVVYNTKRVEVLPLAKTHRNISDTEGYIGRYARSVRNLETDTEVSGRPGEETYNVILIGWTRNTHEEIDHLCKEHIDGWHYRLALKTRKGGNCQHFIRQIADAIVPENCRASAWSYFRNDVYGPFQKVEYNAERKIIIGRSRHYRLRSPLEVGREVYMLLQHIQYPTSPFKSGGRSVVYRMVSRY